MKLDDRLLAVASYINNDVLVDIGCDHGKLAVFALIKGLVKRAVCVDISEGSLKKARAVVQEYRLDDKVEFVCTDGKNIEYKDDYCVVIAGLGGNEICKIVGNKKLPKGSILVPHQDSAVVRKMLNAKGMTTCADFVVKSQDKYYDVIVIGDGGLYTRSSIILGKNAPNSAAYIPRLEDRLSKIKRYHNEKCSQNLLEEKEIIEYALSQRNN